MIYKTLALKIHQPSSHKRHIIDNAMLSYAVALEFLLVNMEKKLNKSNKLEIPKSLMDRLNSLRVEPFKDALRMDAKAILLSYTAKKRIEPDVSYPQVYVDQYRFDLTLSKLLTAYDDGEIGRQKLEYGLHRLIKKYRKPKTIFFCRNAKNRDFSLLYDPVKNRYYAKVYLMNYADASPNPSPNVKGESGRLVYVEPEQEPFVCTSKRIRYIILPLAFGKWQEGYLQRAFAEKGIIKTARLVKKKHDYYLYVNLQFKTEPEQEYKNYLGAMPNGMNAWDYVAVDGKRQIIAEGTVQASGGDFSRVSSLLADQLVQLCIKHRAKPVLGNPKVKSDCPESWTERRLPAERYNEILGKLRQRLGAQGLAQPITVSPRGLYTTCPKCQYNSRNNLLTDDLMVCNKCGHSSTVAKLRVFNLATRVLVYDSKFVIFKATAKQNKLTITNEHLGVRFTTGKDALYPERLVKYLEKERERGRLVLSGEEKYTGSDFKQKYMLWRLLLTWEEAGDDIQNRILVELE